MNHHDKKLLLGTESVLVSTHGCSAGRREEELPQQNRSVLLGV